MINEMKKSDCTGCGACMQRCPRNCIEMKPDEQGFFYPQVREENCIKCNQCSMVCSFNKTYGQEGQADAYIVKAIDRNIRENSASGGVFTLFAQQVFKEGGQVCAAEFDKDLNVVHTLIDTMQDIGRVQKSKYVQSNTEWTYKATETILQSGNRILYVGTPCEIAGLNSFLGKEYSNLLTVDLICHGTPSSLVWQTYLREKQAESGKKIIAVDFRCKDYELHKNTFRIKMLYEDESEEQLDLRDSSYFQGFSKAIYQRPACYQCRFRGLQSGADITIGDFWGAEKEHANFCDGKGYSAIIASTDKGKKFIKELEGKYEIESSSIYKISRHNKIFIHEQNLQESENFWNEFLLGEEKFDTIVFRNLPKEKSYKLEVGLWGSYNSRVGIAESGAKLKFQLSNSSLISLFSEETETDFSYYKNENPFKNEMLEADISKLFRKNISFYKKVDYLIIDFLEERFDVGQFRNGLITISEAFLANNIWEQSVIPTGTKEFIKHWKLSCDKFVQFLNENYEKEQIILSKMFLTEQIGLNTMISKFQNEKQIRAINEMLEELYAYFIQKYQPTKIVEITDDTFCHKYHLYGCYPYHLNYDEYHYLAEQLERIYIERKNYEYL